LALLVSETTFRRNPYLFKELTTTPGARGQLGIFKTELASNRMCQPIDVPGTLTQWYLVYCKPHKELRVAKLLSDWFEIATYFPIIHGRAQARDQPLFPGYLFVQVNLDHLAPNAINMVPGVLQLVTFGNTAQPVRPSLIEALREQVSQINAKGGFPCHQFRPNDVVCVQRGPLRGLEAIFVGPMHSSDRVRILIEFLGRMNEVEVDASSIERANLRPIPKRERRTRGQGRRIKRKIAVI
jgi:transcriptional antiterminator RfaH